MNEGLSCTWVAWSTRTHTLCRLCDSRIPENDAARSILQPDPYQRYHIGPLSKDQLEHGAAPPQVLWFYSCTGTYITQCYITARLLKEISLWNWVELKPGQCIIPPPKASLQGVMQLVLDNPITERGQWSWRNGFSPPEASHTEAIKAANLRHRARSRGYVSTCNVCVLYTDMKLETWPTSWTDTVL